MPTQRPRFRPGPRRGSQAVDPAFRDVVARLPRGIAIVDAAGVVRYANPTAEELLHRSAAPLIGSSFPFAIPPSGSFSVEVPINGAGVRRLDFEVGSCHWRDEPARVLSFGPAAIEDVGAAEPGIDTRSRPDRYALAARASNDGLWYWDLRADRMAFSPRWKGMLGHAESELGESPDEWFDRVHPEDLALLRAGIDAHLAGRTPYLEAEYRVRHRDDTWRWMFCRGLCERDDEGQPVQMAGSQTDVTEQKSTKAELARRAFYDGLTELPNRALFLDRLWHAMRRSKRKKDGLFGVLFLDLDRFKVVNDSLGHMAGDQLLIMIARRIEASLRPDDTVARLGGDEFTILLDDLPDATEATRIAERIQTELCAPFGLRGQELVMTASIGIALATPGYESPEEILRDADTAMYRAKAAGRARHALFDTGMHEHAVALLDLEANLRRAVERDELCLHYQPIVDLRTGQVSGLEALVRWQHPRRGLLSPKEFIPIAEDSGQIIQIGRWVLRAACRQLAEFDQRVPAMRSLVLHVNLSSKQFSLPDLLTHIDGVLGETGLDAHRLRLEITESALMQNAEISTRTLLQLQLLGVQISLDDFGTGYSSLSYLQRFPIDTLKIDRSFVGRMDRDQENLEIARTVVTIGRNLSKDVVAEGIENREQLALLREIDCDHGQGFLFAKPLPADEVADLVASNPVW